MSLQSSETAMKGKASLRFPELSPRWVSDEEFLVLLYLHIRRIRLNHSPRKDKRIRWKEKRLESLKR